MYWELYQSSQIHSNASQAASARSKAELVVAKIERAEKKLESLALACQSLWEIIREHTDLTDDDLMAKMEEVDLRDGKKDGRMSPQAAACLNCHRRTSRRRSTCLYCGYENSGGELRLSR